MIKIRPDTMHPSGRPDTLHPSGRPDTLHPSGRPDTLHPSGRLDRKEYIKPSINRIGIYEPTIYIFSHGKTPSILDELKEV